MRIQQELVDTLDRIGEASTSSTSDRAARFIRMRKLARVARTWHTKPFKSFGEMKPCANVDASDRKAFRRAFVEMMMRPLPVRCIEHADGSTEFVCPSERHGLQNAVIDSRGRVSRAHGGPAFAPSVSLAPRAIHAIACCAERERNAYLADRFRQLTGKDLGGLGKVYAVTQLRFLHRLAYGAVQQFAAKLDPEALKIARRLCLNDGVLVARLAHPDDTVALRWKQAVQAYPALVLEAFRVGGEDAHIALCKVIENGQNLVSHLAKRFGTSEAVIRRYSGVLPQTLHRRLLGQRNYLEKLDIIGRLPVHLRPTRQKEHMLVMELIEECEVSTPEGMTALTHGMKRSLADEAHRFEEMAGYRDVVESFRRARNPTGQAFDYYAPVPVLDALSLGARIRLNRDWHRAIRDASMEASLMDTGPVRAWPGLLKGPVDLGDLVAVELTTSSELVAEGLSMGHCVGGYTWQCLGGRSRIVSLRAKDGQPVTTMEIGRSPQGGYVLRQNYTFGNRRAPKVAADAAQRFMRLLRKAPVANKGPWPALECEAHDRSTMQAVVEDAMHAFWHARYPALICSTDERRALLEAKKREEAARREAWQAEWNKPENVAARAKKIEQAWDFDEIPF